MSDFTLAVSGDLSLDGSAPGLNRVLSSVRRELKDAYWVVNIDASADWTLRADSKAGPALLLSEAFFREIAEAGVDAVTLANNHVWDAGEEGVDAILSLFDSSGIRHAGVVTNRRGSSGPLRITIGDGAAVSVFSVAESQFGAKENGRTTGYARMEDPSLLARIREEKESGNFPVVCAHAGAEMLPIPPPQIREYAKAWVDAGAEAVVFHHAHVLQGMERHEKKPIFYSIGNLAFRWKGSSEQRTVGMTVKLRFDRNGLSGWEEIFHRFDGNRVEIVTGETSSALYRELNAILASERYNDLWDAQCRFAWETWFSAYYDRIFAPPSRPGGVRSFIRWFRGSRVPRVEQDRLNLFLVMIRCASIRWMSERAIEIAVEAGHARRSSSESQEFLRLKDAVCATS